MTIETPSLKAKASSGESIEIALGSVWTEKFTGTQIQVSMINLKEKIVGFPSQELSADVFLDLYESGSRISEIRFEIKTKQGKQTAVSIDDEWEIKNLLADPGSLGAFLQTMLLSPEEKQRQKEKQEARIQMEMEMIRMGLLR